MSIHRNVFVDGIKKLELEGVEIDDTVEVTILGTVKGMSKTTRFEPDFDEAIELPRIDLDIKIQETTVTKVKDNVFEKIAEEDA